MSGPIVRKYGFPNFDQIFGKKELEHGVDEADTPQDPGAAPQPEPGSTPAKSQAQAGPAEGKGPAKPST